ncbi:nucleoside-diphosphate kinase [Candidatus Berkelbacteria bacterium]|uniref:nucleoside-diphosphate kinase n=1 Tax=Candidatus Berkelbacteria bacterium CG10_big_fil_rev_8_21_14_0_10_43_14 TaxID=1974515 RepID=A0A2M6R7Z0_9BACT|nr:nucleoside-diphosphate kinase [Candidatus Berkelbacteria bacterium]OIP07025.1 MAG: nucleoside-diphosphate kinase [Candidatus Berkelbacteria bacterium CG2_30_43_20]PIS06653.1 MAG: nucleoside-diphosphate kinase [Candidatus Berkelbacteria bacterium CG10_big_fil_rev_8_21_14_0_10_43_14]
MHPKDEITYVMIKPDGVKRGLTGEILRRFEQRGLKVVGIRMLKPTKEQIDTHYPTDVEWIERLGKKTAATYEKIGWDLKEKMGTNNLLSIGKQVREWVVEYMISAPVVCIIIKGVHAVEMVRKLAGDTKPCDALPGTIRGDYSVDSPALANSEKRSIYNIVHASETQEEAQHEIKHWFGDYELNDYDRTDDMV